MSKWAPLFSEHVQTLQHRYEALMESHDVEAVLIHSGSGVCRYLDDQNYPYWMNPRFCQWVPERCEADSVLIIRSGKKPLLLWQQPEDYWHAVLDTPSDFWVQYFEVQPVPDRETMISLLPSLKMAGLGPDRQFLESCGVLECNPQSMCNGLDWQAGIKTPYEQACMQEANMRAVKGHRAAEQAFLAGYAELDIHLKYLASTRQTEARTPYQNIVALDQHCAVLHYHDYRDATQHPSRSLLVDAGASHFHYASDITRTYSRSPGLFQDLIRSVDNEVLRIIEKIRPGIQYPDLHDHMHQRISALLASSEIVRCPAEDIYEKGYSRIFFPHGLGHLLGILVHDAGGKMADDTGRPEKSDSRYPALRCLRKLEAGMTLTIEPGLYFIPQLLEPYRNNGDFNWPLIEKLYPFGGIRIEDNIVVREAGTTNFTRKAFDCESFGSVRK